MSECSLCRLSSNCKACAPLPNRYRPGTREGRRLLLVAVQHAPIPRPDPIKDSDWVKGLSQGLQDYFRVTKRFNITFTDVLVTLQQGLSEYYSAQSTVYDY